MLLNKPYSSSCGAVFMAACTWHDGLLAGAALGRVIMCIAFSAKQ